MDAPQSNLLQSAMPGQITAPRPDDRINLVGLSRDELAQEMLAMGAAKFRAQQLWQWIYNRGATEFSAMTSLAKTFQAELAERYVIRRPEIARDLSSIDGTKKWLLRFEDGQEVETVHIPEGDRGTLCVSSQVGCTLTCKFCHTGTQKLVRNLTAAEIVGQIMTARDQLGDWLSGSVKQKKGGTDQDDDDGEPDGRQLTNIVMMGMGEPLYNFENVTKALKIVMDHEGISLSKRKITLSTAGVVPMIERCGTELGVNLAVSLHAVNNELRDVIVPLNRKYPIHELLSACRTYPSSSNARRITFEYVMLRDVNDSPAEARELVRLLKGIPAKVNLIPFNAWPGAPFECSSDATIKAFSDILFDSGYSSPVRSPRGRDIFAACGQLKSEFIEAQEG